MSLCCVCDPRARVGTTGPLNRKKTGAPSQEVTRPQLHSRPGWTLRFEHRTVPRVHALAVATRDVDWKGKEPSLGLSSARCESELGQV